MPQIWLLSHSNVYETAVIAGQFFLFLGLLGWLIYLRTRRRLWIFVTGLGYALAIGSRYNLLFTVAIFSLFAFYTFWQENGWSRASLRRSAVYLVPLVVMALLLGGYNYARFGNFMETGYSYQLEQHGI